MIEDRLVKLTKPQFELVSTKKQFPAFVGGLGSGKTQALITRGIMLKAKYPTLDIAYYLPTYDLVSTFGFPRWEEALDKIGASFVTRTGTKPRIMIENGGSVLFRTMDNPFRIIGYEVADSLVDELDTLKLEDAKLVWQKIIARNRQKKPDGARNTVAVGTTPEGFRFVYEQWKKSPPNQEYHIIKASTRSNARNLPYDYIDTLTNLYPANLVEAYIEGNFINLTSGAVYPEFDRVLNGCNTTIQPNEPLHIGQDFNVTKMASVIFVMRDQEPHAVGELTNVFDTPATIALIKTRYPGHQVFMYPDASGNARKSANASVSDISLLQAANFIVLSNNANPLVKDRVLSMNNMISKYRLKVNCDACPGLVTGLEQQAYDKNGEPDKSSRLDHIIDACGYFITYRFPVMSRGASRIQLSGN
jgi:hypothetical protein